MDIKSKVQILLNILSVLCELAERDATFFLPQKGNEIDKDDSCCFKPDPFALLIHGTQKKGYFKNLKK